MWRTSLRTYPFSQPRSRSFLSKVAREANGSFRREAACVASVSVGFCAFVREFAVSFPLVPISARSKSGKQTKPQRKRLLRRLGEKELFSCSKPVAASCVLGMEMIVSQAIPFFPYDFPVPSRSIPSGVYSDVSQ